MRATVIPWGQTGKLPQQPENAPFGRGASLAAILPARAGISRSMPFERDLALRPSRRKQFRASDRQKGDMP